MTSIFILQWHLAFIYFKILDIIDIAAICFVKILVLKFLIKGYDQIKTLLVNIYIFRNN